MALMLGLKGRRPVLSSVAIVTVLALAIMFMPDSWSKRMNTIQTYDVDTSAMSRIYTWKTLWNLALDRPLVGAGFRTDNPLVFSVYGPQMTVAGYDFQGGTVLVAHSIYFQALGEHGFVGLGLFLGLGVATWRRAGALAKQSAAQPDLGEWVPLLMRAVQTSLLGYAVGGAFLTLVHFDLAYYLCAIVVITEGIVQQARAQPARPAVI
jgi:probable O-glycosylation ligase (exosortase A-associated)